MVNNHQKSSDLLKQLNQSRNAAFAEINKITNRLLEDLRVRTHWLFLYFRGFHYAAIAELFRKSL